MKPQKSSSIDSSNTERNQRKHKRSLSFIPHKDDRIPPIIVIDNIDDGKDAFSFLFSYENVQQSKGENTVNEINEQVKFTKTENKQKKKFYDFFTAKKEIKSNLYPNKNKIIAKDDTKLKLHAQLCKILPRKFLSPTKNIEVELDEENPTTSLCIVKENISSCEIQVRKNSFNEGSDSGISSRSGFTSISNQSSISKHSASLSRQQRSFRFMFDAPSNRNLGLIIESSHNNGPTIYSVKDYSPLFGIVQPGDLIAQVDDENTENMSTGQLTRLFNNKRNIKKNKNQTIRISVLRFKNDKNSNITKKAYSKFEFNTSNQHLNQRMFSSNEEEYLVSKYREINYDNPCYRSNYEINVDESISSVNYFNNFHMLAGMNVTNSNLSGASFR